MGWDGGGGGRETKALFPQTLMSFACFFMKMQRLINSLVCSVGCNYKNTAWLLYKVGVQKIISSSLYNNN